MWTLVGEDSLKPLTSCCEAQYILSKIGLKQFQELYNFCSCVLACFGYLGPLRIANSTFLLVPLTLPYTCTHLPERRKIIFRFANKKKIILYKMTDMKSLNVL